MAPPWAALVFVLKAELVTDRVLTLPSMAIAPPLPVDELFVNVQLSKVTEALLVTLTAPPVPLALLPLKVTLVNETESSAVRTAPPLPVTFPLDSVRFLITAVCVPVGGIL